MAEAAPGRWAVTGMATAGPEWTEARRYMATVEAAVSAELLRGRTWWGGSSPPVVEPE